MVADQKSIEVAMCHHCRKVPVVGFRCCEECRKSEVARIAKVRREARAEGYCTLCRKREFEPGTATCAECKVQQLRHSKARRAQCKAAGICYQCGSAPVRKSPPATACQSCLDRRARQYKARVRAERETMKHDGPERVVEALELHGGELDVYDLAEQVGMSTRHVLRLLRPLEASGRVRRREDDETEGKSIVAKYSVRAVVR